HTAAAPSKTLKPCPDRPDDELRREMGVLGAAGERSIVALADGILQIGADFGPALAEINLARPAEDAVGEIGRTETGEADQLRLFFGGGRSLVRLDFGREPDRSDVIAGAFLPAPHETTVVCEKEVRT